MKMLIPALAYAIVIVAPGLTEPADARAAARKTEPAASKLGGDSFLSPSKTRNVIGVGDATSSTMKIPGFTIEARSSTSTRAQPPLVAAESASSWSTVDQVARDV